DATQMRGGLARRAFGHVQLGQHQEVDVTERPQRMSMLERDDGVVGLADLAEELREHVMRAPRPRLRLDDLLESTRGALLVASLHGLRREDEKPILGLERRWVRADGRDVQLEREDSRRVGRSRITLA